MSYSSAEGVQIGLNGNRFEIDVDGQAVGFAEFRDRDQRRVFIHTVIDKGFAGRGLAGKLISHALTQTRAAGLRIVPVCPFVVGYLQKHDEFADVVDPVEPDLLAWLHSQG